MAQAGQSTPAEARVKELEAENARLREQAADAGRVKELELENKRLREQLADAGRTAPARVAEPSFVFSEGQRAELEATGRTVSPFTGARQVGSGKPGEKPREATADEFNKAKPADKPATGRRR